MCPKPTFKKASDKKERLSKTFIGSEGSQVCTWASTTDGEITDQGSGKRM